MDTPHDRPSCSRCASYRVLRLADTPNGTQYRCESCGREWTLTERFVERRRVPDRRRTTRGDRRKR